MHSEDKFLELDAEIHDTLLDAKKSGHPTLKHFHILYPEKAPIEYTDAIYIGFIESSINENKTVYEYETWNPKIEIVVTTKAYAHFERRKILKDAIKSVKRVLEHSRIASQIKFKEIYFEYDNTNVVQQARLVLQCTEYDYGDFDEQYYERCEIIPDLQVKQVKIKNSTGARLYGNGNKQQ